MDRKPGIQLTVVSPVYCCADCLPDLVSRVEQAVQPLGLAYEIVLVCDASPDASWDVMQTLVDTRPNLRALRLSRNFGQHFAIAAGLENSSGDWVVVMDCDLQDPPEAIPALLEKSRAGYDAVFASRTSRQDTFFKRFSSSAFFWLLTYLTGVKQDSSTANFGIFSRKVVNAICNLPERDRCFPLMVRWTGFKTTQIPVSHQARHSGRSSYTLKKLVRLALDIVLSYSDKPLRLVVKLGLILSLAAFSVTAFSVFRYFSGDVAVAGYTSIIASIWLLGGATIFCLGIVGLYVGRTFQNVKARPYYLVDEIIDGKSGAGAEQMTAASLSGSSPSTAGDLKSPPSPMQ